jgi:Tfp pilus assembly protein PilF
MRSIKKKSVPVLPILLFACATASPPLLLSSGADPAAVTHNTEGIQHYNMAHWDEAKRHFEAAIMSDPKSAEAYYNMALALDKLGDHAKARGYFKRAAELAPGNTAITQSDAYQIHVSPPKESVTGYGLGSGTAASGKFGY